MALVVNSLPKSIYTSDSLGRENLELSARLKATFGTIQRKTTGTAGRMRRRFDFAFDWPKKAKTLPPPHRQLFFFSMSKTTEFLARVACVADEI